MRASIALPQPKDTLFITTVFVTTTLIFTEAKYWQMLGFFCGLVRAAMSLTDEG
jgi:hypothetical protein